MLTPTEIRESRPDISGAIEVSQSNPSGIATNEKISASALQDGERPAFSFLLVNYNMAELIGRCIQSIQRTLPEHLSAEFLVADNSSDPRFKLASETLANARIIECESSAWVDALNRLLPLAVGKYCIVMHTDVELSAGCLETLYRYLETHPRVAIASPDLYYPDGTPCKIRTQFPTLRSELAKTANEVTRALSGRSVLREESCWDRSQDAQVDMVMSVCMVLRREFLNKVGTLDPRLRVYYANDYLAAKAAQMGYACGYVSAAKAVHFERYTPSDAYSGSPEMAYKKDAFSSLARMQADYLVFLRELYAGWKVFLFRVLLLLQDVMLLAAQLKSFRSRSGNIRQVVAAIRMLCYLKPQAAAQNGRGVARSAINTSDGGEPASEGLK